MFGFFEFIKKKVYWLIWGKSNTSRIVLYAMCKFLVLFIQGDAVTDTMFEYMLAM